MILTAPSAGAYAGAAAQPHQGHGPDVIEGIAYEGACLDGTYHGRGRLRLWDPAEADEATTTITYTGEFFEGKFGGRGTVTFPCGSVLTGSFDHCTPTLRPTLSGSLISFAATGGSTIGEWKDGQEHGRAQRISEGTIFYGRFKHGFVTSDHTRVVLIPFPPPEGSSALTVTMSSQHPPPPPASLGPPLLEFSKRITGTLQRVHAAFDTRDPSCDASPKLVTAYVGGYAGPNRDGRGFELSGPGSGTFAHVMYDVGVRKYVGPTISFDDLARVAPEGAKFLAQFSSPSR